MGLTWPAIERDTIRRGGYPEFIRRAWHTYEPGPLVWDNAQQQIAIHMQAQWHGVFRDLLINVPPGTSKSTIATVCIAPWVWTLDPTCKFIFSSYSATLSTDLARKALQVCQSEWYRQRWGDVLAPDKDAAGNMFTRAGGRRFATSVGGAGAGFHCDWFSLDDPIKPQKVDGTAKLRGVAASDLEKAANYRHNTVAMRASTPQTYRRTLTMQRLHEMDPSAIAIADGYLPLVLPMRYDPDNRCTTPIGGDWRTEAGEVLDPKRRPRTYLDIHVKTVGGYGSEVESAQWQQRPAPPGGLVFKRETFGRFTLDECSFADTFSCVSVDCAFKSAETSDSVAIEVWGARWPDVFLFYSECEVMGFVKTLERIRAVNALYPAHAVLIEDKANGSAIIELLSAQLPNVHAIEPSGGKHVRAQAANVLYAAEGRHVRHLADAPWLGLKEHRLAVFPKGSIDDDVDATTQALNWFQRQFGSSMANVSADTWKALGKDLGGVLTG